MTDTAQDPPSSRGGRFTTTHWSLVLAAAGGKDARGGEALDRLCQVYWYPLYAFVRRQGHAPHDAQDLTQEFFLRLLDKDFLADIDRSKGRFRSFLLAALKRARHPGRIHRAQPGALAAARMGQRAVHFLGRKSRGSRAGCAACPRASAGRRRCAFAQRPRLDAQL